MIKGAPPFAMVARDAGRHQVLPARLPALRARCHVIASEQFRWQPSQTGGLSVKLLYSQPGFTDTTRLERWEAGTAAGTISYEQGVEFLVLDGRFEDDEGAYPAGTWLRIPPGASHSPRSVQGCELYVKEGGFPYLRQSPLRPRRR